jgi:hypothetical protein
LVDWRQLIAAPLGILQGILQNRGFGSARDCKWWRRYSASDANSLLTGTGNYFGGSVNLGARTGNFIRPKPKITAG